MEKQQKQVCDIRAGKGMTIAQSNEHLRNGQENAYLKKVSGTMDPTRTRLNFEIGKGGVVKEVDRKYSIVRRIKDNLNARGIVDPNLGKPNDDPHRRITVANIILQGSRERMRELAFGDQQVNYEHGADNSHVTRNAAIEQWAVDMYNFIAKKYGEQNIAAFIVHLDETNPHIHCTLLPITEKNKFSYNKYFGSIEGDRDNGRRNFLQLHDELAEVNKKYGLARGESVARTGAQHKSYLQWLQEQVSVNNETLMEQRQLLYDINAEVKKAEKRLKGLNTMLDNLEKHRLDVLADIELLENEAINDEVEKDEIEAKLRQAKTDLQLTDDKIAQRKEQLRNAMDELQKVADKRADIQHEYDDMRRQINRDLPTLHDKIIRNMESVGWKLAADEAKQKAQSYMDFKENLHENYPGLSDSFAKLFENSFFESMTERATEMTAVASALFLGYIDQATQYAESAGGGGSGPDLGWGRKKGEDDLAFGVRCFILAKNMLTPSKEEELQQVIKKRTGIKR